MTNKISKLTKLTGLTSHDLADVLEKNPRAYMAVKGAVAEKHLARILGDHLKDGHIKKIKEASGDFDKDFYIEDNSGNTISIECKNIEVIKTTKKAEKVSYLTYLVEKKLISAERVIEIANTVHGNEIKSILEISALSVSELISVFRHLPQHLRESGVTRYEFSANQIVLKSCKETSPYKFIEQFDSNLLTIDFQRTRNSTDTDGDTRRNRLYQVGEVDIVAACLFSRTMNWEFIYTKASNIEKHNKYRDRYKNTLRIDKKYWTNSLINLLNT